MDIAEIFIVISFFVGAVTGIFCWEIFIKQYWIKKK